MSWNDAIPASLLLDIFHRDGGMFQNEMDFEPHFFVDPKYLTSVSVGYSMIRNGDKSGSIGSQDHPYFAQTRMILEKEGYIKTEHSWVNGDRVLKPFYFNNVYMKEGEQFSSAAAMGHGITVEYYNDGEILNRYIDKDVYLDEKYGEE